MKQSFNENWVCYRTGEKEKAFAVTLPHDAMQLDVRSETSAGGKRPQIPGSLSRPSLSLEG